MKTFVVLAGLMLIVPHVDPETGQLTSLTVLVLDTAHAGPQFGESVRPHQMEVTNFGGATKPLAGSWAVRSSSSKPITIGGKERLLFLNDVYHPDQLPPLRKSCYGPNFSTECVIDGRKLLQAQITFHGGWVVRPIEIAKNREPRADVVDDSYWGFLRVPENGLPRATDDQRQLAGGILLEAIDGASVNIENPGDGQFATLQTLSSAQCKTAVGTTSSCAVVRFLNTVRPELISGDLLEIDHHHNILYDLFDPAPANRYLLFLRKNGSPRIMNDLFPTGGGGSTGGIRPCMPPAFAPPVSDGRR
jgi:hypothetical protein